MAAEDIVFSGVGKTRAGRAQGLDRGIGQFNIEHEPEGIALAEIAARKDMTAPAVLRVNPDVDAGTHAKISTGKAENKFRSEEHTSELQSLMRISYAVFCLKKKNQHKTREKRTKRD